MRATFATAILVTASRMGAVAQEKGLTGWSGGSKISPARALGQGHQDIPQTPTQAKKLRFMTSSKLVASPLLRRAKTSKAQRRSSHRAKHRDKRVRGSRLTTFNPWLSFRLRAWQIGLEAQSVIALRMLRLAAGGARAEAESGRMVTEKILQPARRR